MHAATLQSPRLRRLMAALSDREWHSTRDLISEAGICAVNSAVAELRANGVMIQCTRGSAILRTQPGEHLAWFYKLIGKEAT